MVDLDVDICPQKDGSNFRESQADLVVLRERLTCRGCYPRGVGKEVLLAAKKPFPFQQLSQLAPEATLKRLPAHLDLRNKSAAARNSQ